MNARLARVALGLYPLAYRRRYGQEMGALLEDSPVTPAVIVDLLRGAARAHLRPEPAVATEVGPDERLRLGLGSVLLCWVLFAIAGLALYKTTENGASEAGGEPGLLEVLHLCIEVLAALGSVAVVVGAAPLVIIALRQGDGRPGLRRLTRRDLLKAVVPGRVVRLTGACAAVVVAAMIGIALLTVAYLVTLVVAAPGFAGEPNGPLGVVSVATSLAILSVAMFAVSVPAALGIRHARRSGLLR
jgi:hypothetical protein